MRRREGESEDRRVRGRVGLKAENIETKKRGEEIEGYVGKMEKGGNEEGEEINIRGRGKRERRRKKGRRRRKDKR